jgi:pimeloyl-ACP methyl ester carboxylesterase
MSSIVPAETIHIPSEANFVSRGHGAPIVLIHGLAASLHDWDAVVPGLVSSGYSTYALDLLGHGDSPKPLSPAYQMSWLVDHFAGWLDGLDLGKPPVLIGHSLGGYVALDYARRFPDRARALVLVDPFYANSQLPRVARLAYAHPAVSSFLMARTPRWLIRSVIDIMSMLTGHGKGGLHALPRGVRAQTALDYIRTAPASYAVLKSELNLTPYLASIAIPTLVVWGERDRTLTPASFQELIRHLPNAVGKSRATGHVPHQSEVEWFTAQVLGFLETLGRDDLAASAPRAVKGARAEGDSAVQSQRHRS